MGIFDEEAELWNTYRVELQFRGRLYGGIPKDPTLIEGWLRAKAGISDAEEIRQAMLRTLVDLGADVGPESTYEQLVAASKALAAEAHTNGFKRNGEGLCIEGRIIKACLKEATNAMFAGDTGWGPTKKAAKSYVAERLFVVEPTIKLGRPEPDGVELSIGHISGPQGKRATLTYYEYVDDASVSFHLREAQEVRTPKGKQDMEARPSLTRRQWAIIWTAAQELGLGARRSQEQGKFDVMAFELIPDRVAA